MARIDIDDPYTSFLESQVRAGLFNTISEAARDAIRKRMEAHEVQRLNSIRAELVKGESKISAGETVRYTDDLMAQISAEGKRKAGQQLPTRHEIRP